MSKASELSSKFYDVMMEQALKDGKITDDEKAILEAVKPMLFGIFERALNKAYEDGVITDIENEQLNRIINLILETAQIVADEDDHLSQDEMELLMSIMVGFKIPKNSN